MEWLILIVIIIVIVNFIFGSSGGGKSDGNKQGGLNSFEQFDFFNRHNKK